MSIIRHSGPRLSLVVAVALALLLVVVPGAFAASPSGSSGVRPTNGVPRAGATGGRPSVQAVGPNGFRAIGTIPTGLDPVGLGVNPFTNRIYVANSSDNTTTVIDGATNTVIATVPVGNVPQDAGPNPKTNSIYVPSAHDNLVTVIL